MSCDYSENIFVQESTGNLLCDEVGWNALSNDITNDEHGYFLSSYICVKSGYLNGTILEVIEE